MTGKTRSTSSGCVDEATERLIQKVCSSFITQLKSDFDLRFNKLEKKLDEMSGVYNTIKNDIHLNKEEIASVSARVDKSEQFAKRRSLRFIGLPDNTEDPMDTVINFINSSLNLQCTKRDISCAFRAGKSDDPEKPRAILVVFVHDWLRNEVFNAKKSLKGSGVAVFEDLTKKWYDLLVNLKKKYGKDKVWSAGGKIFIWNEGDKNKKLMFG